MSKLPYVERPYLYSTGLTGECAYLWALFLRNEADMEDDQIEYSKWQTIVEQLEPKPGRPVPASVHYADIENAILLRKSKPVKDFVYPGSDPQE